MCLNVAQVTETTKSPEAGGEGLCAAMKCLPFVTPHLTRRATPDMHALTHRQSHQFTIRRQAAAHAFVVVFFVCRVASLGHHDDGGIIRPGSAPSSFPSLAPTTTTATAGRGAAAGGRQAEEGQEQQRGERGQLGADQEAAGWERQGE